MMAATTLSVEETNHLRAVYLCYRVAPESVNAYFDKQHPPATLVSDLTTQKSNLQKIKGKILKQYQWNQLYPPTGTPIPASTDFDITLLICLLRNMKPTIPQPPFGFDNLPHSSHITDGAHLARIKYYRNRFAHSTDGKLSNTDFTNYWSDLEVAIIGLGGSAFGKEVHDAKARNLDNTLAEILRQLTKYDKQYTESSDAIKKLRSELDVMDQGKKQGLADVAKRIKELEDKLKDKSDEMSNLSLQLEQQRTSIDNNSSEIRELQKAIAAMEMQNIPNNRKELIKIHLEKWKECDAIFIQTRAAHQVYATMKKNSCLTVTGNSGMGKTMTVRHVALKMLDEGYIIVPISHPEEIVTLFSTQKKTLFVVDDLCGKYTLNQGYLNRLKLKMEDITLILEKQYCKIIATCRLQVFKDVKFKSMSIFNVCECNLHSKHSSLTSEEIKTLAETYFGEHADKAIFLSKKYDYFPFLCSLYHKNNSVDFDNFYNNPFQCVGEELDNLLLEGKEGKYKYCVLVLCIIHNNRLTEECLAGKIDEKTRQMVKDVVEECRLSNGTSAKCLHDSLYTLVGSFITKENNYYKMVHDKLFDFVSFYLGQKMIHILIQHADSEFIGERFFLDAADNKQETTSLAISIPDNEVDYYIDRMISDWTNKEVVEFFCNSNLKSSVFTDKVLYHLNKLDTARQLELVNIWDKGGFQDTPLIQSCFIGNIKLTKWMFNHDVDVNQCRTHNVSPLYVSCQKGYVQIVRQLLQHEADINMCTHDGWSPLFIASCNGNTEVVTELLKNDNVAIDLCNKTGSSSLYMACQEGYVQIVQNLLQHGADINKCSQAGWSPLHTSTCNGHTEVVTELLKNDNVTIDLCSNHGSSSLYIACQKGYVQIVKDLLQHGANINKCNSHGNSPLQIACINNQEGIVSELLKYDVMLDVHDNDGDTALFSACEEGHTEIVKLLLDRGVNVNKCSNTGESSLLVSCVFGNIDIVKMLLHSCDDVNLCIHGKDVYLEEIRKYQKMLNFPNEKTFWTNIKEDGSWKTKEYIDGDDWIIDKTAGASPLHLACFMGNNEIVDLLLEKSPYINATTDDGTTPLFLASEIGHDYLVTLLLTGGADAGIYRQDGKSPYTIALDNGHISIASMLLSWTNGVEILYQRSSINK